MKDYIGVKVVAAEPMSRGEYNEYRGWQIPRDENPEDEGYHIRYPDGYESWCPKLNAPPQMVYRSTFISHSVLNCR